MTLFIGLIVGLAAFITARSALQRLCSPGRIDGSCFVFTSPMQEVVLVLPYKARPAMQLLLREYQGTTLDEDGVHSGAVEVASLHHQALSLLLDGVAIQLAENRNQATGQSNYMREIVSFAETTKSVGYTHAEWHLLDDSAEVPERIEGN